MNLAPIIIFAYNRLYHLKQTIESLQNNDLANESDLFIYSDAPKDESVKEEVKKVRDYIRTLQGFKKVTVIERKENFGLANSIIDGVTDIINKYGKIIVLEDDMITSEYFLRYMNEGLEMYANNNNVASIHGYIYPIEDLTDSTFFIRGADCWGWATWKRAWTFFNKNGEELFNSLQERCLTKDFDFNNSYGYTKMLKNQIKKKNNSWAIRWYASAFLNDMITLYPSKSYVYNIGNDNTGTHCSSTNIYDVQLVNAYYPLRKIECEESLENRKKIEIFFKNMKKTIFKRIIKKFFRI